MTVQVKTRSFFAEKDGVRRFLEISWTGPEVETVVGAVGSKGRVHEKVCRTLAERDAWIATRIARAKKEGFVERSPDQLPTPESPVLVAALDILERHKQVALKPRCTRDDQRDASKLGGTPWLAAHEAWPLCPNCSYPMRFVLQLRRSEVPAEHRWAFQHELIQYFHCDDVTGKADCVFSAGQLVRQVAVEHPPADLKVALSLALLEKRVVQEHTRLVKFAAFARQLRPADLSPDAMTSSALRLYEVPVDESPRRSFSEFLYPVHRIVGWEKAVDVPERGELRSDEQDALDEYADSGGPPLPECLNGEKLGGYPHWRQAVEMPLCLTCKFPVRYLFQIPSDGILSFSIYGDGTAWIFICPTCFKCALGAQR